MVRGDGKILGPRPSDSRLMAACARGDRAAFDALMLRHADGVRSFLRGLACNFEVAQDLTQETFLVAWESRKTYQPRSQVRTWLFAIARNRYVSWVRKQARALPEARLGPHGAPPVEAAEQAELIGQALRLLGTLPEIERKVFVLRVLDGFSYSEIAALEGICENTLRAYASRALSRLRKALGDV